MIARPQCKAPFDVKFRLKPADISTESLSVPMKMPQAEKSAPHNTPRKLHCPWLKRLGWFGFLFFLVKGILWLTVPALLVYFGW
jgi:hypothetical protein